MRRPPCAPRLSRFGREDLYEEIWSEPLIKVAQNYGISGTGLSKICRKAGIPLPPVGYWQQLQYGYKPARPPFPPLRNGANIGGHDREAPAQAQAQLGSGVPARTRRGREEPPLRQQCRQGLDEVCRGIIKCARSELSPNRSPCVPLERKRCVYPNEGLHYF